MRPVATREGFGIASRRVYSASDSPTEIRLECRSRSRPTSPNSWQGIVSSNLYRPLESGSGEFSPDRGRSSHLDRDSENPEIANRTTGRAFGEIITNCTGR